VLVDERLGLALALHIVQLRLELGRVGLGR
jgi:hypothetical protein